MLRFSTNFLSKRCLSTFGYAQLGSRSVVKVSGPDATKFVNGLITSKMIPHASKRLAMTIEEGPEQELTLGEFDMSKNWGILLESPETTNQTVSRLGIYTMFLNSKGRIITDAWIYPGFKPSENEYMKQDAEYFIETDSSIMNQLTMMFKLHKLRSKVSFAPVQDVNVWACYNDNQMDALYDIQQEYADLESTSLKTPEAAYKNVQSFQRSSFFQESIDDKITAFAFDNRVPDSGIRLVLPKGVTPTQVISEDYLPEGSEISADEFNTRRALFGVPEVPSDITPNKFLPLECNLEYMGGVNFDKGCYTGQELTVRTFHTGVVRKRVVPVRIFLLPTDTSELPLELNSRDPVCGCVPKGQWNITSDREEENQSFVSSPFGGSSAKAARSRAKAMRSSGTLLSTYHNIGLALVRLEDFADPSTNFFVDIPGAGDGNKNLMLGIKAYIPYWWPE